MINLVEILDHDLVKSGEDKTSVWHLWIYGVEVFFKYKVVSQQSAILLRRPILENNFNSEIGFVQFLVQLLAKSATNEPLPTIRSFSMPDASRCSLLNLFLDLLPANQDAVTSLMKSSSEALHAVSDNLLGVCEHVTSAAAAHLATKTLSFLSSFMSEWREGCSDPAVVQLALLVTSRYTGCLKLLDPGGKLWLGSVSHLVVYSYNMAAQLYKLGKFSEAEVLFRASCDSCLAWAAVEPHRAPNARSR